MTSIIEQFEILAQETRSLIKRYKIWKTYLVTLNESMQWMNECQREGQLNKRRMEKDDMLRTIGEFKQRRLQLLCAWKNEHFHDDENVDDATVSTHLMNARKRRRRHHA